VSSIDREERERDFWDHHIPSVEEALEQYSRRIDVHVETLLSRLEPLTGLRVLDFACGAGVLSALFAARGADVVGVDISPTSINRAVEVAKQLGLTVEFRTVEVDEQPTPAHEQFDIMVGRFALHHLDLDRYLPLLAGALKPGARAAFIETMATNPALRFARRYVVGRFGIPRIGTTDEHPLTRHDLKLIQSHIGPVEVIVPQVDFFKLLSRQAVRDNQRVDRMCNALDQWMGRWSSLGFLSYHQLIFATKT
jgi:SAM-dependent methyltransferase